MGKAIRQVNSFFCGSHNNCRSESQEDMKAHAHGHKISTEYKEYSATELQKFRHKLLHQLSPLF